MSARAKDDVNLDDLSKRELKSLIAKERKKNSRRVKRLKSDLADVELALIVAAHDRDVAYQSLNAADNAIIVIVEKVMEDRKAERVQQPN